MKNSFTLIELIMTIVILAIVMITVGTVTMQYFQGINYSRSLGIAQSLAITEMAKVNNLAYNDTTLIDGYDNTTSSYEGYDQDLRRQVSYVSGSNNALKQVAVTVYEAGTANQLTKMITYLANVSFGSGSGGAGVGGGGNQADSLSITGGTINGKKLKDITMDNTGGSQIVVTKVKVTFSGESGIYLKKIKMDNNTVWEGVANSGDELTLETTFTMDASTSYNKHQFKFKKNVSTVTVDYYEFEDATQTGSYSWP